MRAWNPEEDRLIIEMISTNGPRWSNIVKMLPGRTISSVRNRWQRIQKGRRMMRDGIGSKSRCQWCGQPKSGHVCFARMRPRPQLDKSQGDKRSPQYVGSDHEISGATLNSSNIEENGAPVMRTSAASAAAVIDLEIPHLHGAIAPSMPIIHRMKSGDRIRGELGFEISDSIAESEIIEPIQPCVIPVPWRSDSEISASPESETLNPSRLPSLQNLAPSLS